MNKVLFEVNYIGNFHGLFNIVLAFGLFFFLYFGMRRTAKEHKKAWERKLAKILMKADIVIIVIYTMHLIKGYADIVVQYKSGNYNEIEGTVKQYYYSQGTDYFSLDGVSFRCSSGIAWGYCQTRENGGVIMGNGQHLKIRYIRSGSENVIVYIEQIIPEERGE